MNKKWVSFLSVSALLVGSAGQAPIPVLATAAAGLNPATIRTVTTSADNGDNINPTPGSLRAALLAAVSGDTILFDANIFPVNSPQTISLPVTLPIVAAGHITIDATGRGVIIDGSSVNRTAPNQCLTGTGDPIGLCIQSSGNTVRGLQILHFAGDGIRLSNGAASNTIGGDRVAGQRNVLSSNGENGLTLVGAGTTGNLIQGNLIGADATGTHPLGNLANGISTLDSADGNTIGGAGNLGNVVGGNDNDGIRVRSNNNTITGNAIGTDASHTLNLGQIGFNGVELDTQAVGNVIGPNNTILHNQRGVRLSATFGPTVSNKVTQNSISDNDRLGIELINGANNNIPAPVIAGLSGNVLSGTAVAFARIEIYTDPFFEGLTYQGATTADGSGHWSLTLASGVVGPIFTATATDTANNTSEFAATCNAAAIPTTYMWPFCSSTPPNDFSNGFGPTLKDSDTFYHWHRGLDIPAPFDTPIYAQADGSVEIAGSDPGYTYPLIQVRATNPVVYFNDEFVDPSRVVVSVGQVVVKGQLLGYSGQSDSGYDHIHFETRKGGSFSKYAVNPYLIMPYANTASHTVNILGVDTSTPTSPYVVVQVTANQGELDYNHTDVQILKNGVISSRSLDYNALNLADSPTLDTNPFQSGTCLQPAGFGQDSPTQLTTQTFTSLTGQTGLTGVTVRGVDVLSTTVSATWNATASPASFSPRTRTQTVTPGIANAFVHTLTNNSSTTTTFVLSAISANNWTLSVSPASVTLSPNASASITLNATPRDGTKIGDTNCLTLMATPQGEAVARAIAVDQSTAGNAAPHLGVLSIVPISGTVGVPITITQTYLDANGYRDLHIVKLVMNPRPSAANGLYVQYDNALNQIKMANDAGQLVLTCTPGQNTTLANSFVSLNCAGITVDGDHGSLTLKLPVRILAAMGGATGLYKVYAYAQDTSGLVANFTQVGTWTLNDQTPQTGMATLSPPLPWTANQAVVVSATNSDPDGYRNIKYSDLLVNTSLSLANGFYGRYEMATNKLYLGNDAGTGWAGSCTRGQTGTIQNSKITVNCQTTTVTFSGTSSTVAWRITARQAFTADNRVWLRVTDNSGLVAGWNPAP